MNSPIFTLSCACAAPAAIIQAINRPNRIM
jgi:hypothetical protein